LGWSGDRPNCYETTAGGFMMSRVPARKWSFAIALAVMSIFVLTSGSSGRGLPLERAASRGQQPDSGITGKVMIEPTCPVERPGKVCERPYQTTITIRREPKGTLVARVQSSATGQFRIALAPGRYLLIPQNGRPYPRSSPRLVTVHNHRYTTVLISYDSGIR
jgi:ribosome modulation factor